MTAMKELDTRISKAERDLNQARACLRVLQGANVNVASQIGELNEAEAKIKAMRLSFEQEAKKQE